MLDTWRGGRGALREQLNAALEVGDLRQQESEMNAALQAAIPAGMPRGGLEWAADRPLIQGPTWTPQPLP